MAYKQKSPIIVAEGGTGVTTMTTAYAPVISGTTATGALQVASTGLSTSGFVLTSNGASAVPSFQAVASGPFLEATGTLTNSQIKALHATPITVVSAPAAGSFILISSITSKLNYGGNNAFVNGGGGNITLNYTGAGGQVASSLFLGNSSITATSSNYNAQFGGQGLANTPTANVEAVPIVAYLPSATEITGNAANDNTISYNITYQIITI